MCGCCKVILLFVIIIENIVAQNEKDVTVVTVSDVFIEDDGGYGGLQYPEQEENVVFVSRRPVEWTWRCDDDQSYYFEPLNECYTISVAQFLNIDPDRKIAYGNTRDEYMSICQQRFQGKLLDIGLDNIVEKMNFVKKMIRNFIRHQSFKRQAIQVGFMIDEKYELISQSGQHYDLLDRTEMEQPNRNKATFCAHLCCVVFLADTRPKINVKMIQTSCDNRTRALSYICETPALTKHSLAL